LTTYEIGQVLTFAVTVKDATGTLVNTGTTPVCTITLPDGTTSLGTITNPSTGNYVATLTSTLAGRHRARWTATGANAGGFPYTDTADVWATDPQLVISLGDARAELNLDATETVNDDELRLYVAATTQIMVDLCSPLNIAVLPSSRVEEHEPAGSQLVLRRKSPTTPTSAIEYIGTAAYTIAYSATPNAGGDSFTYEPQTGILTRRVGGVPYRWRGTVQVSYTWGSTEINPRVVLAARALVAHLWSIGNRGWRPSFGGNEAIMQTPMGYAIPRRVVEMLDPAGSPSVQVG
jgi:hypothetical protein